MVRKIYADQVQKLSVSRRVEMAKETTRILTDRVLDVVDLHEANRIISYQDVLSSQIPRSYAARAFTVLQNAMFEYEIVKCISLWEKSEDNAVTIPAVVELIDDARVQDALVEETRIAHSDRTPRVLNPNDDPEIQDQVQKVVLSSQNRFAEQQATMASQGLKRAIDEAKLVVAREETKSIKNLRDRLAHSLTKTREEQRRVVPAVKYGQESELLSVSIRLIQDLYCWVNGTSFDIEADCVAMSREAAEDLWHNCKFDIRQR